MSPERALSFASGDEPRNLARCVRLNNYWCIKRAGWTGEIASDSEGHVAFASAREGAAVAALLLRRYYLDFGLKTARAIVSRWAPAQCGGSPSRIGVASATLGSLTRRGIGGTLRARWLATHTFGGFAKSGPARPTTSRLAMGMRRSAVPDRVGPLLATPTIMAGPGAPVGVPVQLSMLPYAGLPMGPMPGSRMPALPPVSPCITDGARLANYAIKAADGIAAPDADLLLFDAEGAPTASLARLLANMAAVEIGPLRASDAVIAAGIAAIASRTK